MRLLAPRCTRRLLLLVALLIVLPALVSPSTALAGEQVSTSLLRMLSGAPGVDGVWSPLAQFAREGHTAIYDPVRDRMVVFGGRDGTTNLNDTWTLSLSSPVGTWTQLETTGTPPARRSGHTAIYDPVRDRMVVFGGGTGNIADVRNDVWALSLSGTPTWTQLAPMGTPPVARDRHTAIYDPVRDRMLVFGGFELNLGSSNDVWALSLSGTPTWTELAPTGTLPSGNNGHAAIYDPVRDRMLVFGGYEGPYRNDTWALSLSGTPAWTELAPAGTLPSPRWRPTAIYDPVRDSMVIFGGEDQSFAALNDTWELSLSGTPTWTMFSPGTKPGFRSWHTAIYDPLRDRMVVFAGFVNSGATRFLDDTWMLSLSGTQQWTLHVSTGTPPSARYDATTIYDPVRDRMVVFGGSDYGPLRNDVWALSLSGTPAWTQLAPLGTKPAGRSGHTAIYDPVRDQMVIFGGGTAANTYALSLSGMAWTRLMPTGTVPPNRLYHSAIYDPVRDRMVIFGGNGNDTWALSLSGTPAWTQLVPTGTLPSSRYRHAAVYDPVGDRMVVVGGIENSSLSILNDTWALSLSGTPAWTQLTPGGTPPSNVGYKAIYDPIRFRLVEFGNDGASALSLAGALEWTPLAPEGNPIPLRHYHTAIYDPVRGRMVIFGGLNGYTGDLCDDVWALTWTPIGNPVLFSSLEARADERGVVLNWTLEADEPVLGFEVYRRVAPEGVAKRLNSCLLEPGLRILRDDDIQHQRRYEYFVVAVLEAGNRIQSPIAAVETSSLALTLAQNHPNPFNPTTTISFTLPAKLQTRLTIYDVQGRAVRELLDEEMSPGLKEVFWDGRDQAGRQAASGVYFYELRAGKHALTRKMVLLK